MTTLFNKQNLTDFLRLIAGQDFRWGGEMGYLFHTNPVFGPVYSIFPLEKVKGAKTLYLTIKWRGYSLTFTWSQDWLINVCCPATTSAAYQLMLLCFAVWVRLGDPKVSDSRKESEAMYIQRLLAAENGSQFTDAHMEHLSFEGSDFDFGDWTLKKKAGMVNYSTASWFVSEVDYKLNTTQATDDYIAKWARLTPERTNYYRTRWQEGRSDPWKISRSLMSTRRCEKSETHVVYVPTTHQEEDNLRPPLVLMQPQSIPEQPESEEEKDEQDLNTAFYGGDSSFESCYRAPKQKKNRKSKKGCERNPPGYLGSRAWFDDKL